MLYLEWLKSVLRFWTPSIFVSKRQIEKVSYRVLSRLAFNWQQHCVVVRAFMHFDTAAHWSRKSCKDFQDTTTHRRFGGKCHLRFKRLLHTDAFREVMLVFHWGVFCKRHFVSCWVHVYPAYQEWVKLLRVARGLHIFYTIILTRVRKSWRGRPG